jgi:DNA-binding MarR family transcriptional regulator
MCEKDKAAISRTLSELEQEGMVDRDVSGGNRYRAVLRLTQRGLDAANQVYDRVRLAVEKAGEGLSDAQRSVFYQVLSLISENLKTICTEGLAE